MFYLIGIFMLGLLVGIHYFLARRIYSGLAHFFPKLPFWPVLAIFLGLFCSFLLGFAGAMLPLGRSLKGFFRVIGMYWLGLLIYLLVFSVVAEFVGWILRLCRSRFCRTSAYAAIRCVLVVTAAVLTAVFGMAHVDNVQTVSYEVHIPGKANVADMDIVVISDLHLGALRTEDRLPGIVEQINALQPDLICIVGDFFDTDFSAIENPDRAKQTLLQLSATYGVYACLGNHDAGSTGAQMLDFLNQCNITVLQEEYTLIDDRLILVGRLDGAPIGDFTQRQRGSLDQILPEQIPALPVVVMDHNPGHLSEYDSRVDLILSGHTHRGQIFPGNLITDLLYEVDYGYYRKNAQSPQIIVTSGVSYWGMPMRVGTNCEILKLRILP